MDLTGQSTADMIAAELTLLINNGSLVDGERLVERDLANLFSVSRIPLREAIKILERDGLVEIFRNRGAVVRTLSLRDIDEIYQLRILLEGEAIFTSATRISEDALARAALTHRLLAAASDYQKQGALNREFHDLLYSGCANKRLLTMIHELRNQIERYEYLQRQLLSQTPLFQEEHATILAACQQGNPQWAREEVIRHLETSHKRVTALIAPQPSR